jgi:quinol monooxygenase YgiN
LRNLVSPSAERAQSSAERAQPHAARQAHHHPTKTPPSMNHISWNLKLAVKDGQMDAFRALMSEMVPATTKEEGCVTYDWYVMDDASEVHIQERYVDNAAALVHLGNFGAHFAERFMACVTPLSFAVYGPANEAIRGALTPLGAIFMGHFGGFRR